MLFAPSTIAAALWNTSDRRVNRAISEGTTSPTKEGWVEANEDHTHISGSRDDKIAAGLAMCRPTLGLGTNDTLVALVADLEDILCRRRAGHGDYETRAVVTIAADDVNTTEVGVGLEDVVAGRIAVTTNGESRSAERVDGAVGEAGRGSMGSEGASSKQ